MKTSMMKMREIKAEKISSVKRVTYRMMKAPSNIMMRAVMIDNQIPTHTRKEMYSSPTWSLNYKHKITRSIIHFPFTFLNDFTRKLQLTENKPSSKTRRGPVPPRIRSGCPPNR